MASHDVRAAELEVALCGHRQLPPTLDASEHLPSIMRSLSVNVCEILNVALTRLLTTTVTCVGENA